MIHGGDWLGQEGRRPTTLGLAKSTFLIEDAEARRGYSKRVNQYTVLLTPRPLSLFSAAQRFAFDLFLFSAAC
jgi:hypothetical protein